MTQSDRRQAWYDRRRQTSGEAYAVGYFAEKHGIPRSVARAILADSGLDQARANQAAVHLKELLAPAGGGWARRSTPIR